MIAPLDLAAEREELGPALEEAVLRVVRSGTYVLGPEVERFERDFAAHLGLPHAAGVSSGTDALVLGLLALGVGRGDHVLTSPFSFFASASAIAWIGAVPRFADVDPETGLLDPTEVAAALDERTRCLLPVHLYGQLCDMAAFRRIADRRGLALLEDAAQAHGAARDGAGPGALGDAAAFSFYPTKNLGAAGEAGAVATRSAEVDRAVRELRDHGSPEKYRHARLGTNARMHAIQGAVLALKLPRLDGWNERRRRIAELYDAAFAGTAVRLLASAPGALHARHQCAVRVPAERRDALLEALRGAGIGAAVHYPLPVHLQEAARPFGHGPGDFPHAERLAAEVLCLPVHPFLSAGDAERVARALLELL